MFAMVVCLFVYAHCAQQRAHLDEINNT